jgi:glycosyltransferase involved in cell wall biosynthesis
MKLAIVHDYLNQNGGAENVVQALHEVFPEAPIYTSIFIPENMPAAFQDMDIRTSFMQKLPFLKKHFKKYLMLYPKAMESFDLSEYDVILSSSSAFAKGVRFKPEALHICYCYSPMRFAWNYESYIDKEGLNWITTKILPFFIKRLRSWDLETNKGVTNFISISKYIQDRIKRCYGLDSEMIYPPVNTRLFSISKNVEDYFLVVSRINAYKRIDIVVEAFNQLGLPLRIIGDGPHRKNLQKISKSNIKFLGKVDMDTLVDNYRHCRALIFPGEEDFGIVPVEAQACGRPVIAYAAGGALETVSEGVTGLFFSSPTGKSLIEAMQKFFIIQSKYVPESTRQNALRFEEDVFKQKIKSYVDQKYNIFREGK